MHLPCLQGEQQQQQGAEADAGLVRQLLAAAMHSRAAYGYAMQVSRCALQARRDQSGNNVHPCIRASCISNKLLWCHAGGAFNIRHELCAAAHGALLQVIHSLL
jgi:hypothetical protein